MTTDVLGAILKRSKENNPSVGVTGVLCFCSTANLFLQVLEGGRMAVSALYNRIAQDARHRDVALLSYEEIADSLQIPIGTVKSRTFAAMRALRDTLAAAGMHPEDEWNTSTS